jgi:HSP20 family protein
MSLLTKNSNWPIAMSSLLSNFFDDDRFVSPWLRGQSVPAVNIKETDNAFEIELAAPGYDKSDFKVSIENGLLSIVGEKKSERESNEDNYKRKEFEYSSFTRSFNLPENATDDDIQARYENGVLKLSLGKKKETSKPKKAIDIK